MKKVIIVFMAALMLTSCSNESVLDLSGCKVAAAQSDKAKVEASCEQQDKRIDIVRFIEVCKILLNHYKEFDNFRELLNSDQLAALDDGRFNTYMAVSIIFTWWNNDETFDVMCEWPDWDDFLPNMPKKFWDLYPFYM